METIRDVLQVRSETAPAIDSFSSLYDVIVVMNRHGIDSIAVVDDDRLVGTASEGDVLRGFLDTHRDARTINVFEVMRPAVMTIGMDTPVVEALAIMNDLRRGELPVLDGETVCGVVSADELARFVSRDLIEQVKDLLIYVHGPAATP